MRPVRSTPETLDPEATLDAALAALNAIAPRPGLAQRVLAHLESVPALPWYRRLSLLPAGSQRWIAGAASVAVVAGAIGTAFYRDRAAVPVPTAAHMPHTQHSAIAPAAGVAVNRGLQGHVSHTRHRGVIRSYRASHAPTALPRGTQAPLHLQLSPVPQQP